MRTTAFKTANQDWHALVAYSTEPPSPAAQAYDVAVQAAMAVADIAARQRHLRDDAAAGTLDAVAHQARPPSYRTAMHDACSSAHEADLTGGFNVGCAALLANLHRLIAAGEAVTKAAPMHTAAIQGHLHACWQSAGSLPGQCQQPATLAPNSICTLLEIEHDQVEAGGEWATKNYIALRLATCQSWNLCCDRNCGLRRCSVHMTGVGVA
jgi:hypothetical protein